MERDDRKMFAPMYRREARSTESQLCDVLHRFGGGTTAARLADELVRMGLAIGRRAAVASRVGELLQDLEHAARVERVPDGRYRLVKTAR